MTVRSKLNQPSISGLSLWSCDRSISFNLVQDGCEFAVDDTVLEKLRFTRVTGGYFLLFPRLFVSTEMSDRSGEVIPECVR